MAFPGDERRNSKSRCLLCVQTIKWVPVVFILMIILWSYYAYMYELCIGKLYPIFLFILLIFICLCIVTVHQIPKKIIFGILYHIVLFMFFWAYWKTVLTPVALVPEKFKLTEADYIRLMQAESEEVQRQILEASLKELPNVNRTINGGARYCEKCNHIKPDRAHHCSVCGKCVLKMDHHCPWVNNCIGFTNYKFFILFLGYSLVYCIYICITSFQYFIEFWKGELDGVGKFHILFLFFVALMFAISLISLFVYHCYLVMHNRTTLEAFRPAIFAAGPDKDGFSLGGCNNFKQIFGEDPKYWFIPINSSCGDGISFTIPARHHPGTYHSMDARDTRLV